MSGVTSPAMYSFQNRLFFNDPSLKHVNLVYDNGWNVIYEVDFTSIPDSEDYTDWTRDRSVICSGAAEIICDRLGYNGQ